LKKKWYHLKSSNLSEQEYRMKEKALSRSEEEEIAELKEDILQKLSEAKVKGFESKDELLEKVMIENGIITQESNEQKSGQFSSSVNGVTYELDERTYLGYQNSQQKLLEKLLSSNYFLKNQDPNKIIAEERFEYQQESHSGKDLDDQFNKRKPKILNIKLSRYIKDDLTNMADDRVDTERFIEGLTQNDYHKVGVNEIEKIIRTPSDKSYYNQKLVEDNYEKVKEFMFDLKKRGKIYSDSLTNEELDMIISCCSFSLNGVHYLQKFKKSKNMIHPIDMLYVLSKIK